MTGRRKQGGSSLRSKAESKLRDVAEKHLNDDSSDADMTELVQELQVHQFELEIQNEELRRTQEELSTSRQLFADLFHRAPVGYLVLDKTGFVQDVNETLCKMTDLPASKIKGSTVFDLIAERDREWFIVRYKAIYKHPEGKNIKLSLLTSAGETLPVSLNAAIYKHPETDSPGNSPLLLLTVTDISDRLRAEQALQTQNDLLATVFESSPNIMMLVDADGRVEKNNHKGSEFSGSPQEKLISLLGEEVFRCIDSFDGKGCGRNPECPDCPVRTRMQQSLQQNKTILNEEGRLTVRKAAQEVSLDFLISTVPVSIVNEKKVLITIVDITGRVQAEERYRSLFENMLNGFAYCQMIFEGERPQDFTYLSVNKAFESLTRLTNVVGKKVSEVIPGILKTDPGLIETYGRVAVTGKPEVFETYVESLKMWFSVSVYSPQKGYFVAIFDVITERKQAEEEIASLSKFPTENPNPVLRMQNDGQIIYANKASQELLEVWNCEVNGYLPEDMRGLLSAVVESGKDKSVDIPCKDKVYSIILVPIREASYVNLYGSDITERKKAEQALRESEERLRQIASSLREVIWLRDAQTRQVLYVNPAFEELTGRTCESFYENRDIVIEAIHPDDREGVIKALDQRSEGVPFDKEHRIIRLDGSVRWVSSRSFPVRNEAGEVYRWASIMEDITERKHAEEQLRASEAKFKAVFDNAPVGISLLDSGRRVEESNEMLEHIVRINKKGLAAGAYRNRKYIREDGTEIPTSELASTRAIVENRPVRDIVNGIVLENGEIIWTQVSAAPLGLPETRIVVITQDITERKRAEEEIKSARAFLEKVIDLSPFAMWISDREGTVTRVNRSLCEAINLGEAEIVNKYNVFQDANLEIQGVMPDVKAVFEQFQPARFSIPWKGINAGAPAYMTARDMFIEVSMFPILSLQGELTNVVCQWVDFTERKRMEDELRRSNAELEQFAYVASHDLQEPLRGVAGLAQLLQQRYQGQLDSRADEYITHIVDGSQRMQTLINDLLAYSRIERRGEPIQATEAEAALQATLENLNLPIQEYGASITNDGLPTVQADPTQLIQLFQNLIGNALKFRAERPPQIHVGVTDAGDFWQFSVQDNGIGIEPQYFERIFQVFQRLHTRREYKGTGIGLAICKKIVERHGGHIWVESEMGQGATFYFTLPKG